MEATVTHIPVRLFVDGACRGKALAKIVVDDYGMHEQLVVDPALDLDGVQADRVACQIIEPLDSISYLASITPELIGRDE